MSEVISCGGHDGATTIKSGSEKWDADGATSKSHDMIIHVKIIKALRKPATQTSLSLSLSLSPLLVKDSREYLPTQSAPQSCASCVTMMCENSHGTRHPTSRLHFYMHFL